MKPKIPAAELRRHIEELQRRAEVLIAVLAKVAEEGRAVADRSGQDVNWRWVEQTLTNLRAYQSELSKGVAARDPNVISHAAWKFVSTRKYFADTPLEWSRLSGQVDEQASRTADKAGEVASSIDPFDPANLTAVKQAL